MNSDYLQTIDEAEQDFLRENLKEMKTIPESEQKKLDTLRRNFQSLEKPKQEIDSTQLKIEINEIVWRNCSSKTTLDAADEIATNFWLAIMKTRD